MSKQKTHSVVPVLGHTMDRPVPFKDGPAFDAWFNEHRNKIANWTMLEDSKKARTLLVFFLPGCAQAAMAKLATD